MNKLTWTLVGISAIVNIIAKGLVWEIISLGIIIATLFFFNKKKRKIVR